MKPSQEKQAALSAERVRELLSYDSGTGEISWRVSIPRTGTKVGDYAGYVHKKSGYRLIKIGGFLYLAHRLAWLHHYGAWPEPLIDHANNDRSDNRIENLRVASPAENKMNSIIKKSNVAGQRGVRPCGEKWRAAIVKDGRKIGLGLYRTPEEAHAAYSGAAMVLYGDFAGWVEK